jgi:hypothetical protein
MPPPIGKTSTSAASKRCLLISIDGSTASVVTYQKKTLGTTKSCLATDFLEQEQRCPTTPGLESWQKLNNGKTYVIKEEQGYSCTCLENKNTFAMGPENLGISISHIYETSDDMFNLRGSSNRLSSDGASPTTRIKQKTARQKGVGSYNKEFFYDAGTDIKLPVMELLWMAAGTSESDRKKGVNPLDELSTLVVIASTAESLAPQFSLTFTMK